MTQVKCAQESGPQLARYMGDDTRSLAARRVAFAAQMRAMALSELDQVSKRLKGLKAELEAKDSRRWPDYELARECGIKPRTFQSWQNGEVENQDGKGYDKIARFYSRKLGRKISRQWILCGDTVPATGRMPVPSAGEEAQDLRAQVTKLLATVAALQKGEAELLTRVERLEQAD